VAALQLFAQFFHLAQVLKGFDAADDISIFIPQDRRGDAYGNREAPVVDDSAVAFTTGRPVSKVFLSAQSFSQTLA
jgi:hypothetical protein